MPYAAGRSSWALCDFCSQKCRYQDLKQDIQNGIWTGLLVCSDCNDQDHPQLQVGKFVRPEGITLLNPRPNVAENVAERGQFGWKPILGECCVLQLGVVEISITGYGSGPYGSGEYSLT